MRKRMEIVDEWLMRFFLAQPHSSTTVEQLAWRCKSELWDELRELSWERVADAFMHSLTTHHMHHGRLTQSSTNPTVPGDSPAYTYQLSYQITPQGQHDFTDMLLRQGHRS